MRIPRRSRLVVSWIRSGSDPNGCDLCTPIAELNPLFAGLGGTTNAPTSQSSSQSRRRGGKRSPVEDVAADPNYGLSVTVKGPIPHDSAPNPLALFWQQIGSKLGRVLTPTIRLQTRGPEGASQAHRKTRNVFGRY